MPSLIAATAQSLFVLSLPAMLALAPADGVVRTMAMQPVSMAAVVNATVAVGGRIVSARPDGSLVLAGRRDRIAMALLPLGVIALPAARVLCSKPEGER